MLKQKPYSVHFVCRGNAYRSRLAAAYLATLVNDRFAVSSSGVAASLSVVKTAEPYAQAVARKHGVPFRMDPKVQTTSAGLAEADVIVFMHKSVYDEALQKFDFDARKAIIWDVADVPQKLWDASRKTDNIQPLLPIAERTFAHIRQRCDVLYEYLTRTAWVDVVDHRNQSAGLRLPLAWVTDRGLWHRGVHVVAKTTDEKYVVGKRVHDIVFSPGMLEISLGGGVDSGETPLQAARRETHEEIGILLPEKTFQPLFVHSRSRTYPKLGKQSQAHLYVFSVTLPVHSEYLLRPEPAEVAELRLLTTGQVKRMLRTNRAANFGRLKPEHRLYKKALAYSAHPR